jgi:hypothetical protein
MALLYDVPRLDFERFGSKGWCEVRVFVNGENVVAVASEVIDERGWYANTGLSITNGIEAVAAAIQRDLGIEYTHLVEHYPPRGKYARDALFDETFAVVKFDGPGLCRPRWNHIDKAQVEALIGEPFETDSAIKS